MGELLKQAKTHVEELAALLNDPEKSARLSAREKSARRRAARERVERIEQAVAQLPKLKEKQQAAAKQAGDGEYGKKLKKGKPRVSTTDPDARVMKMGDGGFRPAVNVQFAVDTARLSSPKSRSRAVVGVDVSQAGSDKGLSEGMRQQVEQRTGGKVREHLIDGGFLDFGELSRAVPDEIDRAVEQGVTLFVPPTVPRDPAELDTRYQPKPADTEARAAWRERMGTEQAKEIYRERAATVETVNADVKVHRGLDRLLVRGLPKGRCIALWCGLAYNLLHFGVALIA